jgi:hypothetical protein
MSDMLSPRSGRLPLESPERSENEISQIDLSLLMQEVELQCDKLQQDIYEASMRVTRMLMAESGRDQPPKQKMYSIYR